MVFFGDLPLVRNRPRLAGFTPKPHGVYPFIEESAPIGQVPAGSMLCFVLHRAVHSLVVNNNVDTRVIRHVKDELFIVRHLCIAIFFISLLLATSYKYGFGTVVDPECFHNINGPQLLQNSYVPSKRPIY